MVIHVERKQIKNDNYLHSKHVTSAFYVSQIWHNGSFLKNFHVTRLESEK
jgi:hypothetical protein